MKIIHIVTLLCSWPILAACGNAVPNGEAGQNAPSSTGSIQDAGRSEAPESEDVHSEAGEVRHAGSHTHGDANLAMVLEGANLVIELETPLYNLTGFEHEPETAEQIAVVKAAEATLMEPDKLFNFNELAKCTPARNDWNVHLGEGDPDDDEDDNAEDSEHHGEHDTDNHDGDEVHQDIIIAYAFECDDPAKLSEVDIALFEAFPNMTDLEFVYLGPDTQRLFTLDQTKTKINLRP